MRTIDYVENNPVKAGLVDKADDWSADLQVRIIP